MNTGWERSGFRLNVSLTQFASRMPSSKGYARFVGITLAVLTAGCAGGGVAGDAFSPHPCTPSAALSSSLSSSLTAAAMPPMALQSALRDAATRMTLSLGSGSNVTTLRNAISSLATGVATSQTDGSCRSLELAADALLQLPNTPATAPDRAGIGLVLALTAQALAQTQ